MFDPNTHRNFAAAALQIPAVEDMIAGFPVKLDSLVTISSDSSSPTPTPSNPALR